MGSAITTPIVLTLLAVKSAGMIFCIKWAASYAAITWSRYWNKKRFDLYDVALPNDPHSNNFLPFPVEHELESPLSENQLSEQADEVFFYGVSSKSEYLIVRIARGPDGESEAWIYLRLEDGRTFSLSEMSGFQQSGRDRKTFSCGSLQVKYLSPMRKWRIFFNGMLREETKNDLEKWVYVKFALLWVASSNVYDFASDVDVKVLASGLARAKWKGFLPSINSLLGAINSYAQSGITTGTVQVDGNEEVNELYLFGERVRSLGTTRSVDGAELFHILGITPKNGRLLHLSEISMPNVVENLTFGFVVQPSGKIVASSSVTFATDMSRSSGNDENCEEANFVIDDESHSLKGSLISTPAKFQNTKCRHGRLTVNCFTFDLNSLNGNGVIIKGKIMQSSKHQRQKRTSEDLYSTVPLVVDFSEKVCQSPYVAGGKGSSLGKLTELSRELQNFVVPSGIVVTTKAYEEFVNTAILEKIKNLESVLYQNEEGDVQVECQKVIDEVVKSPIPDEVLHSIERKLQDIFQETCYELKFAVRSSTTGEDTDEISAAGQMETYLGVSGLERITSAVKKCWSSQFSFLSVQYKRQNGQVLNSPMAVVIQEMIPCDVAGVLFTSDPLTGNPSKMNITANYGLGETVVSGSEESDTIEVEVGTDDNLAVKNKIIGFKQRKIVLKDDSGTVVEDVLESEKSACCLSDVAVLRLVELAVKIKECYRSHRDIEWGYWNNNLYIFQSRPVTTGNAETDFEIDHDSDAPMRCEEEYFTVCNLGEVMPGAFSPLGSDTLLKFLLMVLRRKEFAFWLHGLNPIYYPKGVIQMNCHAMFYALDLLKHAAKDAEAAQAIAVAFFGRQLEDDDILKMVQERYTLKGSGKMESLMEFIALINKVFFDAKRRLERVKKIFANYRIPVEKCYTCKEIFDILLHSYTDIVECYVVHNFNSECSAFLNMSIFSILQKAAGEVNADVYADFAKLVTTFSEVASADVPAAVENLAHQIATDIDPEEFKKMDLSMTRSWLETTDSLSGVKYKEFLHNHGHRCLREFDIRSKTWSTDPKTLIQLLQNLVGNAKKAKTEKKLDDTKTIISNLRIPLNRTAKLVIRLLLPVTRGAVQRRESSKSIFIKLWDSWRKGYRKLAKLMVSEGRIPDEDLLYFMNLEEIKELLETRSPKIISKANHRRRRNPVLDKYQFPEIMKGIPKPVNMEKSVEINNEVYFSMIGIPVSQGVAKGFVRVALDLEEASYLQPGEILVTYSTDIGWSPYFPILGGVVTELGGLISHGAVVSREYGIPCIAGLHGATQQFVTGDYVLLNGNKGILQRLPKPEEEK